MRFLQVLLQSSGILAIPAVAVTAAAPVEDPVPLGPLGGAATSVAVDPQDDSVILVTKFDGLYRSTDAGATFQPVAGGPPSADDLTRDPQDPDRVYALSDDTVWASDDFGVTWSALGFVASGLRDLAVPTSGTTLLATTSDTVYRSTDGGATWTKVSTGTLITPVAFAPSDPTIAYYGSIDDVLRSDDGGATWTSLGLDEWIKDLAVSATDPDLVIAGTGGGPFRSDDGGATWTDLSAGLGFFPSAQIVSFTPDGSRLWLGLLDGMWWSTDLGTTWVDGNDGFPSQPPIPLGLDYAASGEVYLGAEASGGGLWRTTSGGEPWVHVGFSDMDVYDVLVGGPGGKRAASSFNGVWAGDPGDTLSATSFQADFGTHTEVMVVDPSNPDRWLAGGVGAFLDNAQIVAITDGGATAVMTYTIFGGGTTMAIAFDPNDANRVLAGIFPGGFGNEAIVRSTNGGASFTPVAGTAGWATRAIAWDPHTPGRVLQLSDNNQWSASVNGGAGWLPLQPAWPGTGPAVLLAFDPHVPGTVYRGDEGLGLQKTEDSGATWTTLGVSLHRRSDLETSDEVPGLLLVSDATGTVKLSGDGGASWVDLFAVPGGSNASGLAIDEADGSVVVGTSGASTWELPKAMPYVLLADGTPGTGGLVPQHFGVGLPQVGSTTWALGGDDLVGGAVAIVLGGLSETSIPFAGGVIVPGPPHVVSAAVAAGGAAGVAGEGSFTLPIAIPASPGLVGLELFSQYGHLDAGAADPSGIALSEALLTRVLP